MVAFLAGKIQLTGTLFLEIVAWGVRTDLVTLIVTNILIILVLLVVKLMIYAQILDINFFGKIVAS